MRRMTLIASVIKICYSIQFEGTQNIAFNIFTGRNWHYYFYGDGTEATGAIQINGQLYFYSIIMIADKIKGAFAPDECHYR